MALIAVDPGLHGGVALLRADGSVLARPMPLAGKELDLIELARIIRDCGPQWLVLEKVGTAPREGATIELD